jgi:SpoIID/LytB domain protein
MLRPDLEPMGSPIFDRDRNPLHVFSTESMHLTGSTYHRLESAPGGPPRSLRQRLGGALAIAIGALALGFACSSAARASTLLIEGAGEGHGVGMSQDGALGYAEHGADYKTILAHYYSGTTIGQAPAKTVVRVLLGSRIKRVPLERYVRGVVSAEMSSSWPAAALQAQAVASRTYALTAHAGGSHFDVYADTRSQVYRGVAAETATTNAAVSATAGQIVLYAGKPAITYFFASSGGMTEDIQDAFPGAEAEPWLKGVPDPYESAAQTWKVDLSFATAAHRLRGLFKGAFRGIEVLKRGVSPRILSARVLGSTAATVVSGPELAGRLGLASAWEHFFVRDGNSVKAEPDHSGQAPATPSPPAPAAPTTGAQGGVSPVQSTASSSSVAASGGTSPES